MYGEREEKVRENFLSWDILKDYVSFVGIVLSIVAVTKNIPIIKRVPTRLWSIVISFLLLLANNLHGGTYTAWDMVMYFINAVIISASANGISDINKGDK